MQAAPAHVYEFGDFQLDTAKRLLRQLDGTTVPLTPRVFETLLYMVEHHGIVLDKERLMEAVWPDSIVEENNLSQNISTLRRIFGETPGSHSYIVTVPGRGYRFVAEVREQTDNGSATVKAEQVTRPTSPENQTGVATAKGRQRLPGKAGGPLALAVLGIILLAAALISLRPTVQSLEKHRGGNAAPATSAGAVAERVHSVAVLPFEPLGQNLNDELLGLGMADAVIGRMSNLKQLVVLPTSAVSKYNGPASDPLAAGRALHVDAILTGSIQRSGDQVRATVQLVHVGSGRTIWSEKFDQTFTDIFDIQDSIADNVVRSVAPNLTTDEQKQLRKHYTTNPSAYESYLMGLYFWNKRSKDGLEKAIDYFGQAVARDPNFALAYALMSDCYYLQGYYGYNRRPDRLQNAKAAAERALLLDDTIAEAHVAGAMAQIYQKADRATKELDYRAAMDSLRRAIALNPNLAIAHQRYAWCLCAFGHLNEAVREMRHAQELDPLSQTNNTALGMVLVFARRYRDALSYCYKAAELAPNEALIQENVAFAYALNGMYQQAIEHYRRVSELNPDNKGDALAWVATVLVSAGRKPEADLMMPEILKLAGEGQADPYNIAVLYGARGEKDAAFEWFHTALQNASERRTNAGDSRMIRYDPMLDPLRSDSRFAALLQQHNRASLLETANSR
jgi:DNA-binding winged helix-turn-helix (wHTH) protein/TolB-like protein/tetratricopeptide (TPR) repeat protein